MVNGKPLPKEPIDWETYEHSYLTAAERQRLDDDVAEELAIIDLAELRRSCKLTQQQLARRMGTSQRNVARLEAAKGATFISVMRVARALGLQVQIRCAGKQVWPHRS